MDMRTMSKTKKTRRRWDLDLFILESTRIHGGKYTYDSVVWQGSAEHVLITCPKHGNYLQAPRNHVRGKGCTNIECKLEKQQNTSLEIYGVINPAQCESVKEKMKKTNLER